MHSGLHGQEGGWGTPKWGDRLPGCPWSNLENILPGRRGNKGGLVGGSEEGGCKGWGVLRSTDEKGPGDYLPGPLTLTVSANTQRGES